MYYCYKDLKTKFDLYVRLTLIIGFFIVYFLYSTEHIHNKLYLIVFSCILVVSFLIVINRWYRKKNKEILFYNLDLNSWEQFININNRDPLKSNRTTAEIASIRYAYMIGDFGTVINKAKLLIIDAKLNQQVREEIEYFYLSATILSKNNQTELNCEEFLLESASYNENKNKISERISAIYDITVKHRTNPYFRGKTDKNKFSKLEILYFEALNNILETDLLGGRKKLIEIVKEDDRLYFVKQAKRILEELKDDK